jgi:hypothetical protein
MDPCLDVQTGSTWYMKSFPPWQGVVYLKGELMRLENHLFTSSILVLSIIAPGNRLTYCCTLLMVH